MEARIRFMDNDTLDTEILLKSFEPVCECVCVWTFSPPKINFHINTIVTDNILHI